MFYTNSQTYNTGWQYLLNHDFRHHVNDEWRSLPSPVVGLQIFSGIFSMLYPIIVVGLTLLLLMATYS